jgi:O-antigen/teichoic acid export membrane protein
MLAARGPTPTIVEAYAVSPANVVPKDMLSNSLESMTPPVLSLLSLVVVAHWLSPEEFGVATISLAIVQLFNVPVERAFHDQLVQRPQIESKHVNTAFTMTLLLAVAACAACQLLGGALETLWGQPLLGAVLRWMSSCLIGTGLGSVLAAMLRRRKEFRGLALSSLGGSVGASAIAMAVAVQGGGVYALVTQQIAAVWLSTLTLWLLPHARPRLSLDPHAARSLIGFGSLPRSRLATNLLVPRIFIVLVGGLLGFASAGVLGLGFRSVDSVRDFLVSALARVPLPRQRQASRSGSPSGTDTPAVKPADGASVKPANGTSVKPADGAPLKPADGASVKPASASPKPAAESQVKLADASTSRPHSFGTRERAIRLTTLAAFPIFAGLALSADDIVPLLFGAQWRYAEGYLAVFALLAMPLFLRPLNDLMLETSNEPYRHVAAMLELIGETAIVVLGMLLIGRGSLWLALLVWTTRLFVSLPLDLWGIHRSTGVSYARQLKSVVTPAIATLGMACVVLLARASFPHDWPRSLRLVITTALEVVSYGSCVALLDRALLREVASMVQSKRP